MVDHFSCWPEAIPITNLSAETAAKTFVARWVAAFGFPAIITTDHGSRIETALFQSLTNLLGTTRTRTAVYHPATNGKVERIHRTLKAAIRAQVNPHNWVASSRSSCLVCERRSKKTSGSPPPKWGTVRYSAYLENSYRQWINRTRTRPTVTRANSKR